MSKRNGFPIFLAFILIRSFFLISYSSGNEKKINKTYQVGDEFISDTFKIYI